MHRIGCLLVLAAACLAGPAGCGSKMEEPKPGKDSSTLPSLQKKDGGPSAPGPPPPPPPAGGPKR